MRLRGFALRACVFAAIAVFVLGSFRLRDWLAERAAGSALMVAGAPSAADSALQSREQTTFFEQQLTHNPDDVDLLNRLSTLYLQRLRESGAFSDLELALRTARHSLEVVPSVRNVPGLTSRTMAEFASHQFAAARDDARTLARLDGSGTPYALLGDAYAELGNYPAAEDAYTRLRLRNGDMDENVATRHARLAALHGANAAAKDAFAVALSLELERSAASPERVAWYSWQLGDADFFTGDYAKAQERYDDALRIYPGIFEPSLRAADSTPHAVTIQGQRLTILQRLNFFPIRPSLPSLETSMRWRATRRLRSANTILSLSSVTSAESTASCTTANSSCSMPITIAKRRGLMTPQSKSTSAGAIFSAPTLSRGRPSKQGNSSKRARQCGPHCD